MRLLILEWLALAIIATISGWILKIKLKRRMQKKLGREVQDNELTSISTWMKASPESSTSSAAGPNFPADYQNPKTQVYGVWQYGTALIMARGASLPDRCVKCNNPANGIKFRRKLIAYRTHSYLMFFFGIPFYLIATFFSKKGVEIDIGLCSYHLRRRSFAEVVSLVLASLGLIGVVVGLMITSASQALASGVFGLGGAAILLGASIYYALSTHIVFASEIDDQNVWLAGVTEKYLEKLPRWPHAPKY